MTVVTVVTVGKHDRMKRAAQWVGVEVPRGW